VCLDAVKTFHAEALVLLTATRMMHPSLCYSKLALFLPNPVDHKKGSARWEAAKHVLVVSLPVMSTGISTLA
jgi:hypothetical protein